MKTAVIAPLGLSPPVITAGTNSAGSRISDLVIIATNDPNVLAGLDLIRVGMSIKAPGIRIHAEILPYNDIMTTEQNLVFMECIVRLIKRERVEHRCDRILLNVAGGRKNMCITMALIGQLMNVDGIFHIVNKEISLFNQNLERLRSDIRRISAAGTLEEKQAIYREKEKQFNAVLYPSKSKYQIVKVPTFPVDQSSVQNLILNLRKDVDSLAPNDRRMLERHGILEKGKSHYYLSDYGRQFMDAFI